MAIDKLTAAQEALLHERLQYWLALGRSTAPLDRPAATEAICALYQSIGKPRPAVLFFSSPAMCILAWGALQPLGIGQVRGQLRGRLVDHLDGQLQDQLQDQLRGQIWSQVGGSLVGELRIRGRLWGELYGPRVPRSARGQLYGQLMYKLDGQLLDQLGEQLQDPLDDQLGGQLDFQLWGQLDDQLLDPLDGQLRRQIINHCSGTWWCAWEVFYDYCHRIGGRYTSQQRTTLDLWITQSTHCHWWFPYDGIVFASDRPRVLTVDDRGRLHSSSGPALAYSDGYSIYAWHGLRVEPRIIDDAVTVGAIEREANAEIRRILLERYGWSRYIQDCGAQVVDSVPTDHPIRGLRGARLLVKELPGEPEPIVYLEMRNSTPEPDGTHRRYLERIDPKAYDGDAARLCHAASASRWHHRDDSGALVRTFERWQDYLPTAES